MIENVLKITCDYCGRVVNFSKRDWEDVDRWLKGYSGWVSCYPNNHYCSIECKNLAKVNK